MRRLAFDGAALFEEHLTDMANCFRQEIAPLVLRPQLDQLDQAIPTGGRGIFFGPEVAILGDERFTQWRVGAHVTQMKFGKVELDVSAGYAHDSIVGEGAYGTFELSTNF